MVNFENLSIHEQELLLKFPAYISLLAANTDGKFDEAEKRSTIEFEHIKTYSCDPLLVDFFKEVDKNFVRMIEELDKALPLGKANRDEAIKSKLEELEKITLKLDANYSAVMHQSMKSFKEHVSRAHHNVLVDFIFPIPIKGLSY